MLGSQPDRPERASSRARTTVRPIPADHQRALARDIRTGAILFPGFLPLDLFAAYAIYPEASVAWLVTLRLLTPVVLYLLYLAIAHGRWPRVAHIVALGVASVSVALLASEVGGPESAYMHGLTLIILVRAATVAEPLRESLAHGLFVAAVYPATFAVLIAAGARYELHWGSLSLHYALVISAVVCASAASRTVWYARQQLEQARKLGRYRLEARLGHGAQGEVWLAHDAPLDREVALKILRARDASPEAIAAFEREARLISKLKSPHTVRVHDFGASDDGIYFMAMEHLVGHDLSELVKLFGPVSPAHAVHLIKQVCHSLEEAHHLGLVHLDVKPSNLFVVEVGETRDVVKLLDFGIARSTHEGEPNGGSVSGTPAYLAPEVVSGAAPRAAADLYALGATLYFLVTGTAPFAGDVAEVLRAHVHDAPEEPSRRLGRPVPRELEAIILRCLEKDPSRRWSSAAELRGALERCANVGP